MSSTSSSFSLAGYIHTDAEVPDGEHRPAVFDATLSEPLPRPLVAVHQGRRAARSMLRFSRRERRGIHPIYFPVPSFVSPSMTFNSRSAEG